ncbi:LuxR family transcriptional regulator [Roseinatronobacter sp. HJB301]|uniref:LuxR family transcriptional regulator n=1 Tax=Roseinatronobacter alkalisoli TaxID=3028235 RepID=A0ABT5T5H0_9RHOB|nr:LuxR family transcriptional regulator [Roseinatronobacter sp. HJB301]MDD7970358.1 LuxR family transcriptional regulator [Roseinatronobacter sp. HJB301]
MFDLGALPDKSRSLSEMLDDLCARLELDYAAYAGVNTFDNSVHAVANYPEPWKQHYLEFGLHEQDPSLRHAARSHAPVHWGRLVDDPGFRSVFSQAHDFHIPDTGVTIPVRGPFGDKGMLSVSRRGSRASWDAHSAHIMRQLQESAALIHDTVMHQGVVMRVMRAPNLSRREVEILQWIAAGKTQSDISDILTISARTVEVHMRSVRAKLGALTTAQAVARAIGLGLIFPM